MKVERVVLNALLSVRDGKARWGQRAPPRSQLLAVTDAIAVTSPVFQTGVNQGLHGYHGFNADWIHVIRVIRVIGGKMFPRLGAEGRWGRFAGRSLLRLFLRSLLVRLPLFRVLVERGAQA